jgi:peptide/nickel transport system permease protein
VTDRLLEPDPVAAPDIAEIVAEPLWRVRLRLFWRGFRKGWSSFAENRIGLVGLSVIVLFGLMALAQPILIGTVWEPAVYDPVVGYEAVVTEKTIVPDNEVTDPATQVDLFSARLINPLLKVGDTLGVAEQPARPSSRHLLGTDSLGRDVLSQLMFSSRAAFMLGIVAALVSVFIATTVGAVSAFFGGPVDTVFMRLADLVILVPFLPILIVLSALIDFQLFHLALLIGVLGGFGGTAIILKSQALSVSVKPFIDAARIAGGGRMHLIFRHIIPNVLPLSFLFMMFAVTDAIGAEATLSFLGLLNIDMSWGIMIYQARVQGYLLDPNYWWLIVPAGLAVSMLAGSFFLVGRAMDEIINPRLRRR